METAGRGHALVRWLWRRDAGAAATLARASLLPAELAFRAGAAGRNRLYDRGRLVARQAPIPVVSVGNLTVGGTGKTPFAAYLARRLLEWGRNPAVILRGYGDDEVLVHLEVNPTIPVLTSKVRLEAVRQAAESGCDCAVLDDGFQHRALRRDLDLVLVSADRWGGGERMLPRGPFREPVSAIRRADLVLVTRKSAGRSEAEAVAAHLRAIGGRPTGVVRLGLAEPRRLGEKAAAAGLEESDLFAVTSMADPDSFLEQLRQRGARVGSVAYPDHHEFQERDVEAILERASGRMIAISQKEEVKLRGRFPADIQVLVYDQELEVEMGEAELEERLREAVAGR